MGFPIKKKGKQGRWASALTLFFVPILLIFIFRWVIFEPFVIPSESMMPNLLVHDHILVSKYSYGIKTPLGDGWLKMFKQPDRGDIVVFRFPENRDVFYIKRLIGLPGDKIRVQNGQIILNDKPWTIQALSEDFYNDEADFNYFIESTPNDQGGADHLIRVFSNQDHVDPVEKEFVVPENSYFFMGDNRDESQDSRLWGYVDQKYLIGLAAFIWLSCDDTIPTAPMICDPLKLRPGRMFKRIGE